MPDGSQAVVLAGGLATRMLPRTETVPKAMLEVAGRPFVDWQLELLARSGIREVVMCIAHLGERIRAHVGDGSRYRLSVLWSEEAPGQLLGTAGAIRAALPLLADTFVVTYGDSYLPFDYGALDRLLRAHGDCDGVMSVFHNAGHWDTSNVITDGTWVVRYEKTEKSAAFDHIDYGATALRRDVIAALPAGKVAGLDAIQRDLAATHRLRALVARERFFEIGSPQGLADLGEHLRAKS
ncbi:MAG: Mannose-phosphate guanyltransferase [Myxococcales bacterium]|nr:Mannose-phosphate guanyltransferase [Myxococcales bacterium]